MSISKVIDLQQHNLQKIFGKNDGYWEYRTFDNEFLCYTVRYNKKPRGKLVIPWRIENGELKKIGFSEKEGTPFYNIHHLKMHPEKPILLVEGEKTADAGVKLFPEFNSITWLGGSSAVNKIDYPFLAAKIVYLIPDNDDPGFEAMKYIIQRLTQVGCEIHYFDVSILGVREKWDIANLYDEHGEIDTDLFRELILTCPVYKAPEPVFDMTSYPNMSEANKPKPLDTMQNFEFLLKYYKIACRWNMMSRIREIDVPGVKFYVEERDNAALNYITDLSVTHNLPSRRVDKHLDMISWRNPYHPIRDWILSKPLTEENIFNRFLATIKTTDDNMSYLLLRKWMLSAVYALFNDTNFCAQGVLVIQGEPGTHKSSFIMSLVPQEMRAIKGGLSLDPSKKDDIFTSAEYWIAELGELDATFRKADIARLKSHITNDVDDVRRAYAIRNSRMIRRTVYAATVNESRFLVDTTGNRRWWTISITEPINTRHGLDMQQIWRSVYELYLKEEEPFLTKQEMLLLNENNKEYELLDPFYEKLITTFYWDHPPSVWMNSSQILNEIGYEKPNKADLKRMGDILSTQMKLRRGSGRLRYSYMMPDRKMHQANNVYEPVK